MSVLERIKESKRVVVKIGTSTLTYENGKLNIRLFEKFVRVLCDLKNKGIDVILVSSGAIGVGVGKLGLSEKPRTTMGKQAVAAVGQCELMYLYDKFFSEFGYSIGQILLTKDVVENKERKKNVINTFNTLLEMGVIPIVNENDTVSVEEIEFGDNDTLSAVVATLVEAQLLIILTDIDGLYNKDPKCNDSAKIIRVVNEIDDKLKAAAGGAGSNRGTGGMITKLLAAQIAKEHNINTIICNGAMPELMYDILDGKEVGTLFVGSDCCERTGD